MLWRAALARRQLYGKVPGIQAIDLSYHQLHPRTGLGPGVEGTDSVPKSELTEACGLATNNLSQHYTMYS